MYGLVGTVSDFCLCWFCCFCLLSSVNYCLSNPLIRSHWKNEVGHHKDSLKISYLELEFLSFNIPDRDFSFEFFKLGTRSDWTSKMSKWQREKYEYEPSWLQSPDDMQSTDWIMVKVTQRCKFYKWRVRK